MQLELPAEAGFSVTLSGTESDADATVATITLNRPERLNSQLPVMWEWLVKVSRDLPATVRVVVLRAEGRAFSAGLDRSMFSPTGVNSAGGLLTMAAATAEEASATIAGYQSAFGWLSRPDIVSIAIVQGHAIGAGFQIALACDLRIVVTDAQFTMAEPTLGLVPDLGGTKRLVELVGYSKAAEICLTGRRVGAVESERIGLASTLVQPEEVESALAQTVQALLAVNRDAAIETKALLLGAGDRTQTEQEIAEREAQYRRIRELASLLAEHGG
ncbi:enoyl-CoA hydratase/carnithine racemase [Jatrophihabitans sp. GAS493]|uniref:enoyl-CoA hydratase/isomerase family protein n=1 Tax=Jatrophihabitans sp. GAS493 TaxID=1907575 RepID=UPI000BB78661|nr:enoyl-CoA hydratase/isomerase family protein [Jatrophihabitans sp. GAS493]SOD73981.1 enoyl-CoA hydratase/carnithine racemase [Jatrophihabitans sp. GAS493]